MSSGVWTLGRRPALDGLRAFAVALVLSAHVGIPGARPLGGVGVTVFFALSGFLITTLLLEERAQHGSISFRGFYVRRIRRLTPALVACVVLGIALEVAFEGTVRWEQVAAALTYTTNLYVPSVGAWPGGPYDHTWSLAVEEQFYLLWPLALLALARLSRREILLFLPLCILGSAIFRVLTYQPGTVGHSYVSLISRADELLIGAALAVAMHGRPPRLRSTTLVAPLLVAIVAAGFWCPGLLMPTVVALLTAGVVQVAATSTPRVLSIRVMTWLGQRSYGIYLYNTPVVWAVEHFGLPWQVAGTVIVAGSIALAAASYRWVEQPFLARRGSATQGDPQSLPIAAR
ncbi:acyltransferase family protein [Nocardioides cavernaquae]|uniref:Acyltransferase n=1 Tax=Nocardioides cavernaquae TaxID=2321396 RepID=A0A3A5HAL8_9ACTN|nr:acyltransferase [Nocardioides cavernaquae]RJS45080.1 acyltransferase [Nocardioides cavernaquae]